MSQKKIIAIIGALVLVGSSVFSLAFWARLPGRLPSDADYLKANELISSRRQDGDVIVLAPAWAERGRQFLTAAPVFAGYDLTEPPHGASRVWLVALSDVPGFSLWWARKSLAPHARNDGSGQQIGELWVEPWTFHQGPIRYSFTDSIDKAEAVVEWAKDEPCRRLSSGGLQCPRGDWNKLQPGWFEVNEQPVYCLWAHPTDTGAIRVSFPDVPAGKLNGWAALVGQAADGRGASVEVQVDVDGRFGQQFSFANTFGKQPFSLDLSQGSSHRIDFVINAQNAGRRHFCFDAWIN